MDRSGWGVRKDYQDFLSEFSGLIVPKNSAGEFFSVSPISGIEIFYAREVLTDFSFQKFLSHSGEIFRRGILLCCIPECFR